MAGREPGQKAALTAPSGQPELQLVPAQHQSLALQSLQQQSPAVQDQDHGKQLQALLQRDRFLDQLREDQETHHHKQIWTKDYWGGYHKVESKAIGPLGPSGSQRGALVPYSSRPEDLLGYETVEVGPTTNLVGNHMTRSAVQLVEAELAGLADRGGAGGAQGRAGKTGCVLPERRRAGQSPTPPGEAAEHGCGAPVQAQDGRGCSAAAAEAVSAAEGATEGVLLRGHHLGGAVKPDLADLRQLARTLLQQIQPQPPTRVQ